MTQISYFDYKRCPHDRENRTGVIVRFEAGPNAHFLAAALQEFARSEGAQAWACEMEDDGVFTVRIHDSYWNSGLDLINRFGEMVRETARGQES